MTAGAGRLSSLKGGTLLRQGPFPPSPDNRIVDRSKPGVIAVTRDGQRFCNETDSCHRVIQVMPNSGVAPVRPGSFHAVQVA